MQRTKDIVGVLTDNKIQLLITIGATAIAIVNFIILARLSPVFQSIALNSKSIEINAHQIEILDNKKADLSYIEVKFDAIEKRLIRIENKLDR